MSFFHKRAAYSNIMELTYNELKKRDVINVVDGQCLGRITDLRIDFPRGVLTGIYVPGRRMSRLAKLFSKSTVFIDESNIIKIGGDVILVDLKCGNFCSDSSRINRPSPPRPSDGQAKHCPPPNPCPPPCPPICPPPKPPRPPQHGGRKDDDDGQNFSIFSSVSGRIDTDDY